jgi:hypothetical protein
MWWILLLNVIWKCACHFKLGTFTACVEKFSIFEAKKMLQPTVRFDISHSVDFEDSGLLEGT